MNALAPAAARDRYECVVIDDDPDICALISHVLSKIGVSSLGLPSADALERALMAPHPEAIFLDVALDRSDAIDGIRILRRGSFAGAVQLISGKDAELLRDIKAIGERHGLKMLDPVRKPFRSENLRRIFAGGRCEYLCHLRSPRTRTSRASAGIRRDPAGRSCRGARQHWLDMAYQPKVRPPARSVCRRRGPRSPHHPLHGVLSPQSFLPQATEAALNKLTEFVVKKAFLDWEVLVSAGATSAWR